MEQQLISVVMSVYNGEKYLAEAINSILNQTYQNFEFIIIDDCSTDNSLEILDNYAKKDSRIKIIKKDKNIGIEGFIKNLNYGISIAKGNYIARMDQDDISMIERFQKQLEFLENNPEISLVGAQINFINENNEIIGERIGATRHNEIVEKITSTIQLFHPVIMFRNYLGIKYREKFLYCEDYDFYLNFITQGKKLANIDEKLLNYRILESSISRKGDNFIKKMMVAKSIFFYELRKKSETDFYENFDNQEVLEINNFSYKNKLEELFFASKTAIKTNNQEKLKYIIRKIRKFYPNENIPLKYLIFANVPMLVFRVLKKIF